MVPNRPHHSFAAGTARLTLLAAGAGGSVGPSRPQGATITPIPLWFGWKGVTDKPALLAELTDQSIVRSRSYIPALNQESALKAYTTL